MPTLSPFISDNKRKTQNFLTKREEPLQFTLKVLWVVFFFATIVIFFFFFSPEGLREKDKGEGKKREKLLGFFCFHHQGHNGDVSQSASSFIQPELQQGHVLFVLPAAPRVCLSVRPSTPATKKVCLYANPSGCVQ